MPADPLEQVLRLVAEGRLTADEAAPILAALDERPRGAPGGAPPDGAETDAASGAPGNTSAEAGGAGSLRIEIRDRGRKVVNLRLPMAVARLALDRVPGLSPDDAARVREALESGMQGAIIDIDDDAGDGVRIVAE